MVDHLVDRKQRESELIERQGTGSVDPSRVKASEPNNLVTDTELFDILGNKLRVVKKDGD